MSRYIINGDHIARNELVEGNKVFIIRGFSINELEQAEPNTIYLDGAFKGPLFNTQKNIYSLDHHENCIRQITKSTCEQALLFCKFNDFKNTNFNIIGNDPDLDTIFAAWILLNIDKIQNNLVFKKLIPLILIAGNIDSYGFGYEEMTGFSAETILQEKNRINWLRKDEIKLKEKNEWNQVNFLEYTVLIFNKLDEFLFFKISEEFYQLETSFFPLKNEKLICYVKNNNLGIYDVEKSLTHNDKIECVILNNGSNKFTIKLTKLIPNFSLEMIWNVLSSAEMLEKINLNINANNNPQLYFTNWGGASNLGGSPRYFDGRPSYLNPENIIQLVLTELNMQL